MACGRIITTDADILNRQINVDGSPVRVIGVLPKGFELPTLQAPDVMLPTAFNEGLERKANPERRCAPLRD